MKRIKLLAGFSSLLCSMLLCASGVSAQVPGHTISDMVRDQNNTTGYTFCEVAVPHPGGKTDTYYSNVFSVPQGNLGAASDAFVQFLAGKYSLQVRPTGTCQNDLSARETDAQSRLERTEGTNSSFNNIFKTGWAYPGTGSAGTAPPAPAQAMTAQPTPQPTPTHSATSQPASPVAHPDEGLYGFCMTANDPRGVYYSAVFSAATADYSAWTASFTKFLNQKYGPLQGYVACNKQNSLASEQAYLQKSMQMSGAPQGNGRTLKVIETGWKYTPQ